MLPVSSLVRPRACVSLARLTLCQLNAICLPSAAVGWQQIRRLSWIPLREQFRTIPNYITLSRIVASPLLGYAVATDMKVTALAGCVAFGFSDWLDGFLAKRLNQSTTLGAFLDPMADKVMIGCLSAGLVFQGLLPWQLFALFLTRDLSLIACVFVLRSLEKPEEADFFDTGDTATFQITPSAISKVNTGLQFALLGATLSQFAFGAPSTELLEPLWWVTASTTVWSGLGYIDGSGLRRVVLQKHEQRKQMKQQLKQQEKEQKEQQRDQDQDLRS